MGRGSYTSADWEKLKKSASIDSGASAEQLFKKTSMDERFNPYFVNFREAMDSEDHPHSTPIIIGLDVTGSMGYLSEKILKEGLHETMMKLYSTKPVNDPQLLFAAIGDVTDNAPLQVTQFESDIRIAEQLMDLWLEGAGGDSPEDYQLLWYFAAKHTKIDSFDKRGKKGFLFTIGDADCHNETSAQDIQRVFNDNDARSYISKEFADMALKKYEVFHINIYPQRPQSELRHALPGRVMSMDKTEIFAIPELLISTMQFVNGMSIEEILNQWSSNAIPVVRNALTSLSIPRETPEDVSSITESESEKKKKFIFF